MSLFSGFGGLRPVRPLINPRAQQANLITGERIALLRHLHLWHQPGHEMDERTLGTLAGPDGGGVIVSTLESGHFVVQAKPSLVLVRPVTFNALRLEERLDVFLELHWAVCGGRQL